MRPRDPCETTTFWLLLPEKENCFGGYILGYRKGPIMMERFELNNHTIVWADKVFGRHYMVIMKKDYMHFALPVYVPLAGVKKIDLTYIDSLISRRKTNKMKIYENIM
jgi:hypothetical protein